MTDFPRGHVWYYAVWLPAPSLAHVHHARETQCVVVPDDYQGNPEWLLGLVMEIKALVCIKCRRPYWMVEYDPVCIADSPKTRKHLRGGKSDRRLRDVPGPGESALERAQSGDIRAEIIGELAPAAAEPLEEITDIPAWLSLLDGLGHDWIYQIWLPAPSSAHARTANVSPFVTLPDDYNDAPGWNEPVLIDIERISCRVCDELYRPSTRTVCRPGKKQQYAATRGRREDAAYMQASRLSGLA
ncbi:hypothetical protein ACFWYW_46565 [Nonomuraea sp. NPDC059023]|uniref:hypothetical protein n=1 Tax=unclassified Nonomuraea TaxID=2593643 RepID=UPI003699B135